jgi:poly(3-hydroxybutyrate) depolymerase
MMAPLRLQAEIAKAIMDNPWNPLADTPLGRKISANAEMIERQTRRFARPEFGLHETIIGGKAVEISEAVITEKPFCRLINFERKCKRNDPTVLIVAPMSGHYATLLRGTVKALLPHHNVYITDWEDARQVTKDEGPFSLDSYIAYLREFISILGPDTHIIAVCQPTVPVLATVSLMASDKDPNQPASMTLMGGPVDTRISKTEVTELAETRPLSWFENNAVYDVPFYYPGAHRRVYPGFLQLSGFMSMNLDRHVDSYQKFYQHLIEGDGESAEAHRKFYDEYLAVMDIPAEFYLQTIEYVFQKQLLPRGMMKWQDPKTGTLKDVRPQDIEKTALLTIEGELDDISARGQTTAAHELCYSIPQSKQYHHFQLECGHYGIFNGRRWREQIMPRIRHFIRQQNNGKCTTIPKSDLEKVSNHKPERYNRDIHGIAAVRRWIRDNRQESHKENAD